MSNTPDKEKSFVSSLTETCMESSNNSSRFGFQSAILVDLLRDAMLETLDFGY